MITFLLDNSLWLICLIALAAMSVVRYCSYKYEQSLSHLQMMDLIFAHIKLNGSIIIEKILTAIIIGFFISFFSYREFWLNDVFNIVLMTLLLAKFVVKPVKKLLK